MEAVSRRPHCRWSVTRELRRIDLFRYRWMLDGKSWNVEIELARLQFPRVCLRDAFKSGRLFSSLEYRAPLRHFPMESFREWNNSLLPSVSTERSILKKKEKLVYRRKKIS